MNQQNEKGYPIYQAPLLMVINIDFIDYLGD